MNTRKTTHDPDDFDMFYPYDRATGKRYAMRLSDDDRRKVPFRGQWTAIVTDQQTGIKYRVRGEPCGLGCHCDASAEPIQ